MPPPDVQPGRKLQAQRLPKNSLFYLPGTMDQTVPSRELVKELRKVTGPQKPLAVQAEEVSETLIKAGELLDALQEVKAVDAYLDRAMQARLTELERSSTRRESVIGTIVALVVGVSSILISHYASDFRQTHTTRSTSPSRRGPGFVMATVSADRDGCPVRLRKRNSEKGNRSLPEVAQLVMSVDWSVGP